MGVLDGKVAVVTGGTSGIGARITEEFVAEGARVVMGARREDVGESFSERLGPNAAFVRTDVTVEDDVVALIGRAVERWGRLDCLVNNVGVAGIGATIANVDLDRFDDALRVHVRGVLTGMKHSAPSCPPKARATSSTWPASAGTSPDGRRWTLASSAPSGRNGESSAHRCRRLPDRKLIDEIWSERAS